MSLIDNIMTLARAAEVENIQGVRVYAGAQVFRGVHAEARRRTGRASESPPSRDGMDMASVTVGGVVIEYRSWLGSDQAALVWRP